MLKSRRKDAEEVKKLLLTVFLPALLGLSIPAFAQQSRSPMKPLSLVLAEFKNERDLAKISYFLMRCSGFSYAMAGLITKSGGIAGKATADNWSDNGATSVQLAFEVEKTIETIRDIKINRESTQSFASLVKAVYEIANVYVDRMNNNYVRSGNYVVDDLWLKEEMEFCRNSTKIVEQLLE